MQAERARLRRLQRLERVRAIAKQTAASEAARAEGTLAQLEALAERTGQMLDEYRSRSTLRDGMELRQLSGFVSGLQGISLTTRGDAAQARLVADRKQEELAIAERRRAAVEERAQREAQAIDRRKQGVVLTARREIGTGLE